MPHNMGNAHAPSLSNAQESKNRHEGTCDQGAAKVMKLVNFTCPGCGAQLNADASMKRATCQYCGMSFPVDDEAQHVKFDGAEQAGYEFEKGRQRAQQEQMRQTVYAQVPPAQPKPKRKTWLWVLGWIFLFPVPLTIIMLKNESVKQSLNPKARYAIIAAAWLLYLAIGLSGGGSSSEQKPAVESSGSVPSAQVASVGSAVAGNANAIDLVAGEKGEYGRELVMSEGTDMQENLVVYYVPAGTYTVKNLGDRPAQVSVYAGTRKGDNGYDEYTETGDVVQLGAGDTAEITVPDGWFVEIQEPAHISLTAKG